MRCLTLLGSFNHYESVRLRARTVRIRTVSASGPQTAEIGRPRAGGIDPLSFLIRSSCVTLMRKHTICRRDVTDICTCHSP